MGTFFGFVVGYVLGARVGSRGFDEVVSSLTAVRDSSEFRSLVSILGSHARGVAHEAAVRLATDPREAREALREAARRRAQR